MAGSTIGRAFCVTTWGESHGEAVGVCVDGCPAGVPLSEEDIQIYLDRRRPGQSRFSTKRSEDDKVQILSGVFDGKTTGTPIAMTVQNLSQRSSDYSAIEHKYRPGHADYGYDQKYGFRDFRGGGRSSGRETVGRVAAGAVAARVLETYGILICAYTVSIGPVDIDPNRFDLAERDHNPFYMPDSIAAEAAQDYIDTIMKENDSAGGVVECVISGVPAGVGEPVFDKLDACLAQAVMSIGAVKGFEVGDGFAAARLKGSEDNDEFFMMEKPSDECPSGKVGKKTNHAGGILGGLSDGSDIVFRAAFKPTPSIAKIQQTVTDTGEDTTILIEGRHDPVIVPRAVVVVEAMAAITVLDLILRGRSARI